MDVSTARSLAMSAFRALVIISPATASATSAASSLLRNSMSAAMARSNASRRLSKTASTNSGPVVRIAVFSLRFIFSSPFCVDVLTADQRVSSSMGRHTSPTSLTSACTTAHRVHLTTRSLCATTNGCRQ
jgi:hypothetical protein